MRKNKIRILHVAQAAGGVDHYIRMLLKYLDKDKFENILVCGCMKNTQQEHSHWIPTSRKSRSVTDEFQRCKSKLNNAFVSMVYLYDDQTMKMQQKLIMPV